MSLGNRSEELAAKLPRWERAPAMPASAEQEQKTESFEHRGERILSEAAVRVTATWSGIRSRLSSFGDRLLSATRTGVGAGAAGIEGGMGATRSTLEGGISTTGKTLGAGADYVRSIPTIAKEMIADAGKGITDFRESLVPRETVDMEAVATVEMRMQRIRDMMNELDPGPGRNELVAKYEQLEAERAQLLNTPLRGTKALKSAAEATKSGLKKGASVVGTGLAMGAAGIAAAGMGAASGIAEGGRWVGGKVGEMREARRQEQEERRREYEDACEARAELFLMDAAAASGEPMQKLSREHLIVLGEKLEESLARRIAGGAKELGKGVFLVDDVADIARNLGKGALDFAAFARSPEDRTWLMNELRNLNIEGGKALETAFAASGKRAIDSVKRGGRAVGRAGAAAAVGTVTVGVGLALAGAETIENTRTVRAAKEAVVEKWQEHAPAIQQGLAGRVNSLNRFADNVLDVTRGDGLERTANELSEKLNAEAEKAGGFFNRMKRIVDSAVNVAKRKFNEFMLEVAQGSAQTENPELVAKIGSAVKALEQVDAEEARQNQRPSAQSAS